MFEVAHVDVEKLRSAASKMKTFRRRRSQQGWPTSLPNLERSLPLLKHARGKSRLGAKHVMQSRVRCCYAVATRLLLCCASSHIQLDTARSQGFSHCRPASFCCAARTVCAACLVCSACSPNQPQTAPPPPHKPSPTQPSVPPEPRPVPQAPAAALLRQARGDAGHLQRGEVDGLGADPSE